MSLCMVYDLDWARSRLDDVANYAGSAPFTGPSVSCDALEKDVSDGKMSAMESEALKIPCICLRMMYAIVLLLNEKPIDRCSRLSGPLSGTVMNMVPWVRSVLEVRSNGSTRSVVDLVPTVCCTYSQAFYMVERGYIEKYVRKNKVAERIRTSAS